MNEDLSRKRLGRGLAALIGEMDKPESATQTPVKAADRSLPIEFIAPNPHNPRRNFADADLTDLAQSIRAHGIVQPVVVRPASESGRYEIIAGERRWRAAQRAGLTEIPVIVRDVNDRVAMELAIVENVQRADLNPIEEASGYQQLITEHQYTQADLAGVIGKSRSHVTNTMRLLRLPDVVRDMITDGSLSAGHARTLVNAEDPAGLARKIIGEGLSVRQAEAIGQTAKPDDPANPKRPAEAEEKDADTLALEKLISDSLGLKVVITHRKSGGDIKINYNNLEQLDELCRMLRR